MRISVIIPALNEAGSIGRAIGSACGACEIIVADGGSADATAMTAEGLGAKVVVCPSGRGGQMDSAAKTATGDVLLFLHADTRLPEGWQRPVEQAFNDAGTVGGAFRFSVDRAGLRFRLLEKAVNLRARATGLIYGDQAIFARRDVFFSTGGFRRLPLMEDVDCVRRLRAKGKIVLLDQKVATSGRRWERRGITVNFLRNSALVALYYSGVSSDKLCSLYYKN